MATTLQVEKLNEIKYNSINTGPKLINLDFNNSCNTYCTFRPLLLGVLLLSKWERTVHVFLCASSRLRYNLTIVHASVKPNFTKIWQNYIIPKKNIKKNKKKRVFEGAETFKEENRLNLLDHFFYMTFNKAPYCSYATWHPFAITFTINRRRQPQTHSHMRTQD